MKRIGVNNPVRAVIAASILLLAAAGIAWWVANMGKAIYADYKIGQAYHAIDADITGPRFEEITQQLSAQGLPVTPGADQPLKNAPRGWPIDHPRIHFLRWKGAAVVQEWTTGTWMHTPQARERIRDVWAAAEPLKAWLDEHVSQHNH